MLRFLFLLLLLVILASPLWIPVLVLQPMPLLQQQPELSVDDVANAKRLLKENDCSLTCCPGMRSPG